MLDKALEYLKMGLSVVPARPNDKIPAISWKHLETEKAKEDEVKGWFNQTPTLNIGFATGKVSGISVLDLDVDTEGNFKHDLDDYPVTLMSKTPRGGYHLFYKHRDGINNSASQYGKNVDVRGDGGFLVLPPSVRKEGEYKFINWGKGENQFTFETLPDFPKLAVPEGTVSSFSSTGFDKNKLTTTFQREKFKPVTEGSRNDSLAKEIGSLIAFGHRYEDLAQLAYGINARYNPPLQQSEVDSIINSIWARHKSNNPIEQRDWMMIGESVDKTEKSELEVYPTGMFLDDVLKHELDVRGGLRQGDLGIISGLPGQGKTLTTQTMAFKMSKFNRTGFFSYEMPTEALWLQFGRMQADKKVFQNFVPHGLKSDEGDIGWIVEKIKEGARLGIKIFFIDNLDFLSMGKKEKRMEYSMNQTTYLKNIITELKNVARDEKVVVVLIAHTKKNADGQEMQDIADTSGAARLADWILMVKRLTNKEARKDSLDVAQVAPEKDWSPYTAIRVVKNRLSGVSKLVFHHIKDGLLEQVKIEKYAND